MNNSTCQVILLYLLKFYFVSLKSLRNPVRSMYLCYSACRLQRGNGGWRRHVGNLQGKRGSWGSLRILKGKQCWSINYKGACSSFSLSAWENYILECLLSLAGTLVLEGILNLYSCLSKFGELLSRGSKILFLTSFSIQHNWGLVYFQIFEAFERRHGQISIRLLNEFSSIDSVASRESPLSL